MSNTLTPRDYLECKVEHYGSEVSGLGNLRAIAASEPKSFLYIKNNRFAKSETKYHLFPGICEVVQANAIYDLLRDQLKGGNMYAAVSMSIKMGNSNADTGFFMTIPAPRQVIEVNLGVYALKKELFGDDLPLNEFRKSLEGTGALE